MASLTPLGATLIWPIHANSVIYVLRAQECMRLVLIARPRSNLIHNPKRNTNTDQAGDVSPMYIERHLHCVSLQYNTSIFHTSPSFPKYILVIGILSRGGLTDRFCGRGDDRTDSKFVRFSSTPPSMSTS